MSIQSLPVHEKVKTMLINGLRRQRISHAYIFSGPAGTGKLKTALALAQSLFCSERKDGACGQCADCRKMEHGNHERLYRIAPEGTAIKIEQIRDLQRAFAYRHDPSQKHVYIIEQAEKMTPQAANSLLKFLEEPSPGITGILLTENGQALLPTLRSRSQWIEFAPLPPDETEQALIAAGIFRPLARLAAQLRAGAEGARELAETDGFAEMRSVVIQLMKECIHSPHVALVTAQQKLFRGDRAGQLEWFLDMWTLMIKDMIYVHCGKEEELVFCDQTEWIRSVARKKSLSHWIRCLDLCIETRNRLRLHVQPQLALERLMLHI